MDLPDIGSRVTWIAMGASGWTSFVGTVDAVYRESERHPVIACVVDIETFKRGKTTKFMGGMSVEVNEGLRVL